MKWNFAAWHVLLILFCFAGCSTIQKQTAKARQAAPAPDHVTARLPDVSPGPTPPSTPELKRNSQSPPKLAPGDDPLSGLGAQAGPLSTVEPEIKPGLNTVFNPGFNTINHSLANDSSIAGIAKLDPALLSTLEAMGAKNSIPEGIGAFWYPAQSVQGQKTKFGFTQSQLGVTAPLWSSTSEVVFGNFSLGNMATYGSAFLPEDRRSIPHNLWDVEAGAAYIKQIDPSWSWGLMLGIGSVSDRPFAALADDTISGSVFVRWRQSQQSAWLLYVVSTTEGQVGQNIPIPGVAYEFITPNTKALSGFPFLDLKYKITEQLNLAASYTALTDTRVRMNYQPTEDLIIYQGFTWSYQPWLLHNRPQKEMNLFSYEKRLEAGVNWLFSSHVSLNVSAGFAFDRYFVENDGFSLHGKNEVDLGSTPYLGAQLLLQY